MILSICDTPEVLKIMKLVKILILIIRIAVPIILIVMVMIDFIKPIVDKDADLGGSIKLVTKRLITAVIIFLLPTLVSILINIVTPNLEYKKCFSNATDEKIRELYINKMEELIYDARTSKTRTSYNQAKSYLINIENEDLYNKYKSELDEIEKMIKDDKKSNNSSNEEENKSNIETTN